MSAEVRIVERAVFNDAGGPRCVGPRKVALAEERRERDRDNASQESADRVPMPLKLIFAALMGASRG